MITTVSPSAKKRWQNERMARLRPPTMAERILLRLNAKSALRSFYWFLRSNLQTDRRYVCGLLIVLASWGAVNHFEISEMRESLALAEAERAAYKSAAIANNYDQLQVTLRGPSRQVLASAAAIGKGHGK